MASSRPIGWSARPWLSAVAVVVVCMGAQQARLAAAPESIVDAARAGDRTALRALIASGLDVNSPEPDGTTALHWAVRRDDIESVRMLVDARANVNATNRYGVTALALSAVNGSDAAMALLLKAGAHVDAMAHDGETALMLAARTGSVAAVTMLIAHGARVDARDGWMGETALMWAAGENHPEVIRVLLDAGASIDAVSNVLDTPRLTFPRSGGPNTPFPRGGWTALMHAARLDAIDAARVLATAGAKLDLQDPDGTTALVFAIINNHFSMAALLLAAGANPNIADDAGMAALYAAVDMHTIQWTFGRPAPFLDEGPDAADIIRLLLERGASPNARLKGPVLPRHHDNGDRGLAAGTTPLMRAARMGDVKAMRILVEHGADVTLTQPNGNTVLMFAAGVGYTGVRGDGPRIKPIVEADALEAVLMCLAGGVDVDAFNDQGQTAMHGAVGRGDSIVRALAEHGAILDTKDKQGRTPLDTLLQLNEAQARRAGVVRESTVVVLRELLNARASARPGQPASR